MTVAGEASDGHEAIVAAASMKPDVVILELGVRDTGALMATRTITSTVTGTRVLVLSTYNAKDYLSQALRSGASGYILKDAEPSELMLAVRTIAQGGTYVADNTSTPDPNPGPDVALTPRQREVLQLMAQGRTTREIAALLKVSVKTVETHRAQLMEKTKIRDVAGLVRLAIRMGLAGL